jgi:hypothetical protein
MNRIVDRARVVLTGVVPEHRDTGLVALLSYHVARTAVRYGMKELEFSWVLEDNAAALQTLTGGGAEVYKTYRLYEKAVG